MHELSRILAKQEGLRIHSTSNSKANEELSGRLLSQIRFDRFRSVWYRRKKREVTELHHLPSVYKLTVLENESRSNGHDSRVAAKDRTRIQKVRCERSDLV
jgi:hypothetical protein